MDINGTIDSNDTTPSQGNDTQQINPGAIRKSTTQSILKAVSNAAGMEFQSIEDLTAALARLSAQTTMTTHSQPVEPQPQAKRKESVTDLQDQFLALKADLLKKDHMLREKELDSEIRGSMGDRFDSDLIDYALSKVKSNIQWNDDGTYSIVNSKGQIRYDSDGNPLGIQGLVAEVAKNNPKLLKQSTTSAGSGLRMMGNQFGGDTESIPDYATDPAAFKAWAQRNGLGRGNGLKGVKATVSVGTTSKRVY